MKIACAFAVTILAACAARGNDPAICTHRGSAYAPPTLGSLADARTYVGVLHAGGRVALLNAGSQSVLVVYVYGAAAPDAAIAAYREAGGRWVRAREWSAAEAEAHAAVVEQGAVVVVGARSGRRCVLVEASAG